VDFVEKSLYKWPRVWCLLSDIVSDLQHRWCEELYEAKAAQLILYGRALGLSHSEAEDVVHETFLALLQLAEPPEQAEHYCLRSFRNRALNFRRSLWRRLTRELESSRWFERAIGETPQERAAMRALTKLPPEQREVIVLKIWHQHTFEMIGQLLELSPNTVAGRYRYGLQKLRGWLKAQDYERVESNGEPIAFLDAATALPES
jgi:RNA polymerase sigma-70 factor (ECF subfamily)